MTESKCSVCWKIKKKTALQPVTDTIEALIREYVYSGYSRQIEAYSDKICNVGTTRTTCTKFTRMKLFHHVG